MLSEQAVDDLTDIYTYIAALDERAARQLVNGIKLKIRGIATLGLTGSPQPEIGSDIRMIVYRPYRIFFKITATHLYVLRVLHGRQRIDPSLFHESDTD